MRFPLHFKDVAEFVPVDGHTPLPSNITIATGNNRHEKYEYAVQILQEDAKINAVVLIDPPQRDNVRPLLDGLFPVAANRRIRMDYDARPGLSGLFRKFSGYLSERKQGLKQDYCVSDAAILPLTDFWENHMRDCVHVGHAWLAESILTYVPLYTNGSGPDSYVNLHIDHGNMDYRIVECLAGSGTVLCADEDFDLERTGNEHNAFNITLLHTGITCWELMEGSTVVMRGPHSERPCAHAHGIGGREMPEQRMTMRHDLVIA